MGGRIIEAARARAPRADEGMAGRTQGAALPALLLVLAGALAASPVDPAPSASSADPRAGAAARADPPPGPAIAAAPATRSSASPTAAASSAATPEPSSRSRGEGLRLLLGARFRTLDPERPLAEALAVGADGRIVALGEEETLAARFPAARRIDLGGGVALPGLVDAHGHLLGLGLARLRVDLSGARSVAEVLERLRASAEGLPEGAWLIGRGWDQTRWEPPEFPTAAMLDALFPTRPVWLVRVDGHAAWANSAALAHAVRELAGDWQPEGGRILRDGAGRPTGVLIDAAMALVRVPPPDRATRAEALARAVRSAAAAGLTGVHDAGMDRESLELLAALADRGELPLRVHAMADGEGPTLELLCREGPYRHPSGRLAMRAVKLYADGALGSRGAALLRDYADERGHRGLLVTPEERLRRAIRRARDCGLQPAVHAIGDRANRLVLDLYARELAPEERRALRPRIEHAQVVHPRDLPRFAALGVIASMQPIHATSDMRWAEQRLGAARLRGAYAWRSLLAGGAVLAFGSDFPVEPESPILGLHAALTRTDREGRPPGGWLPEERLGLAEAIAAYTRGAAYAAFAEGELGRLAPGFRADLTLLEDDPFGLPPEALPGLRVLGTLLDGERAVP